MYIKAVLFFPTDLPMLPVAAVPGTAERRRQYLTLLTEKQTGQRSAVQAAVLPLPGLLVDFSFSMGVSRYDMRNDAEIRVQPAVLGRGE